MSWTCQNLFRRGYFRCLKVAMQVANLSFIVVSWLIIQIRKWTFDIKGSLWFLAFAGKFSNSLTDLVMLITMVLVSPWEALPEPMEGQNWWKMTLLKLWSPGWSLLGQSCLGPKCFRAEVGTGPKCSLGWSILQAEVCFGPKYALGRSECGAKAISGPNWVWAIWSILRPFK